MSHSVCYVANVSGIEFNARCPALQQASDDTIEILRTTGSRWDGDVPSVGVSFTAELTGLVTIIWLTTSYTAFLADPHSAEVVHNWEKVAFSWLSVPVARIDEFVLNKWESLAGELWFTDPSACTRFWDWTREQDPLHWKFLENASKASDG
jgi:hypothetical protein